MKKSKLSVFVHVPMTRIIRCVEGLLHEAHVKGGTNTNYKKDYDL